MKKFLATNIVTNIFNCSLERAFKTPILGDATKILIGYGNCHIVSSFKKDETWGKENGSRVPVYNNPLFFKPKESGIDEIFVRQENKYWKWGVKDFDIFFTDKAIGEWFCVDNQDGTISVKWQYTWSSSNMFMQPLNWLFVKTYWRKVMANGMKIIKQMAENEAPYLYN